MSLAGSCIHNVKTVEYTILGSFKSVDESLTPWVSKTCTVSVDNVVKIDFTCCSDYTCMEV
jgi:hypothetical protein